tara:strand:+ start:447 stop:857 length:411 start_codon:yes stop_codon:yes gene_type:complete
LSKKPSKEDLKIWKDFIEGKDKLYNKDRLNKDTKYKKKATIDLHGFSLDEANNEVEKFIKNCFEKKIEKLIIITGKGLRSKIDLNPYQSRDMGILKYSVPEFIKLNSELMKIIKKIESNVNEKNLGYFTLFLKIKE